jgi:hypothetical protein
VYVSARRSNKPIEGPLIWICFHDADLHSQRSTTRRSHRRWCTQAERTVGRRGKSYLEANHPLMLTSGRTNNKQRATACSSARRTAAPTKGVVSKAAGRSSGNLVDDDDKQGRKRRRFLPVPMDLPCPRPPTTTMVVCVRESESLVRKYRSGGPRASQNGISNFHYELKCLGGLTFR